MGGSTVFRFLYYTSNETHDVIGGFTETLQVGATLNQEYL